MPASRAATIRHRSSLHARQLPPARVPRRAALSLLRGSVLARRAHGQGAPAREVQSQRRGARADGVRPARRRALRIHLGPRPRARRLARRRRDRVGVEGLGADARDGARGPHHLRQHGRAVRAARRRRDRGARALRRERARRRDGQDPLAIQGRGQGHDELRAARRRHRRGRRQRRPYPSRRLDGQATSEGLARRGGRGLPAPERARRAGVWGQERARRVRRPRRDVSLAREAQAAGAGLAAHGRGGRGARRFALLPLRRRGLDRLPRGAALRLARRPALVRPLLARDPRGLDEPRLRLRARLRARSTRPTLSTFGALSRVRRGVSASANVNVRPRISRPSAATCRSACSTGSTPRASSRGSHDSCGTRRLAALRGRWMYFYTSLRGGGRGLVGVNVDTGAPRARCASADPDERFISDEAAGLLYVSKGDRLVAHRLSESY